MCGIALIVGPGADERLFRRMLASIRPRGDVEESLLGEGLLAGTQRLRIVDRERAVQPWLSADGRFLLCYNGEVYNHRALRAELAGRGHRMRTDGDTEVVLEAFLEWGEQAVHRLRGEYAFAIVERATGRTYLARDPLGVKPLYWSRAGGRLHVASEVKALVPVDAACPRYRPASTAGPSPPLRRTWSRTSTCCASARTPIPSRTRPRRSASSGTRCPTASGRDWTPTCRWR